MLAFSKTPVGTPPLFPEPPTVGHAPRRAGLECESFSNAPRIKNHAPRRTDHAPRIKGLECESFSNAPRTTGKGERATAQGPWAKFWKIDAQDATANAKHSQTQQARGVASKIQSNTGNARSIAREPSEQTIGKKIARGVVLCTRVPYYRRRRGARGARYTVRKGKRQCKKHTCT